MDEAEIENVGEGGGTDREKKNGEDDRGGNGMGGNREGECGQEKEGGSKLTNG